MGIMDGLSHWLRQIIAVILLASLIDLLLPNRTMQRYVRLVAGLFILMTLATPILHWMKGDFTNKLSQGLSAIETEPQNAPDQLAMIEADGSKLRDKQNAQAAKLVTARLEASIRSEVEQNENRGVSKVDVSLERGPDGEVQVAKVVVLLEETPEDKASADEAAPTGDTASSGISDIDPVAPVDIRIEVESWPKTNATATDATDGESVPAAAKAVEEADRETRTRVSALIASRFGIATKAIEVMTPTAADEKK